MMIYLRRMVEVINMWLLIVSCFWTLAKAYPEHGFSASIKTDQDYSSGTTWEKIKGWEIESNLPGHYLRGLEFDSEKSTVVVRKAGIYYVSAHILLADSINKDISIAVIVNNDVDKGLALYGTAKVHYSTDIDIFGFVQLSAGDKITVYGYCANSYKIRRNSALSFRFHDYSSSVPGFLFSLENTIKLEESVQKTILGGWVVKDQGQFSSSSTFREKDSKFQIAVDGIYMISANILISLLEKSGDIRLNIYIDDTVAVSSQRYLKNISTLTMNVNDMIRIPSRSLVSMELVTSSSRINVFDTSTYSIQLITPAGVSNNGFHANLDAKYNKSSDFMKLSPWQPDANKTTDYLSFPSSAIVDGKYFNVDNTGFYYVSTHLQLTVELDYRNDSVLTVALFNNAGSIFMETSIETAIQTPPNANDTMSVQSYSVNLGGTFLMTPTKALCVAIKGDMKSITIHGSSSFSVAEIQSSYPGTHSIMSQSIAVNSGEKISISNWKTSGIPGLYDFTKSMNMINGLYTATQTGVYLLTANIIVEDVDMDGIKAFISADMTQLNNAFIFSDANPVLKMSMSLGGFVSLQEGQTQLLFLEAKKDEDWRIRRASLSASFIGVNPNYFQSKLSKDMKVPNAKKFKIAEWNEISPDNILTEGEYKVPFDGVYFTIATVVLDGAHKTSLEAFYKLYIAVDEAEIKGLYSKRETAKSEGLSNAPVYTLFLSGCFYAKKGQLVSVHLEMGVEDSFTISDASRWGVVYRPPSNLNSGALATLFSDTTFPSSSSDTTATWQNVGSWEYSRSLSDGKFEEVKTLDFEDPQHVFVSQEGMYVISGNVEVQFSGSDSTLLKIAVAVNGDDGVDNGMTQWHKSRYSKETIHVCGTIFLRPADKVSFRFSANDFPNVRILFPSGFSFFRITETGKSSSFTAKMKNEIIISKDKQILNNWQTAGALSSENFNSDEGAVLIPFDGSYWVSGTFSFKDMDGKANGIKVSINTNNVDKFAFVLPFDNENITFTFSELLHVNTSEVITLGASSLYNITQLQSEYNLYLNKSNTTNATLTDPYDTIQVALQEKCSSFSLMYLKDLKLSKNSEGSFVTNRRFDKIGEPLPLQPWEYKLNPTSTGAGGFDVDFDGVYMLVTSLKLENVSSNVKITFSKDDQNICSSVFECKSSCTTILKMNCFAKFNKGDFIIITITINKSGLLVKKGSTRVIAQITTSAPSAAVHLKKNAKHDLETNNWALIGPWSKNNGSYGLFTDRISIYHNELVMHASGTYQVAANIIVRATCLQPCFEDLEFGLFINEELYQSVCRSAEDKNTIVTANILVGALLLKWDRLSLKIKASSPVNVEVLKDSTFSTVQTEPPPFARIKDAGPTMVSHLTPYFIETSTMGLNQTWTCQAYGDGVITYTWYKNDKVVKVENGTESDLAIAGYINDTGVYHCVAEMGNIKAPTNKISVDIHDIDECSLKLHECSDKASCVNTPGSYKCICKEGSVGDGRICIDENECMTGTHNCHNDSYCINMDDTYTCYCKEGFLGNGTYCQDIDECHKYYSHRNNCSELATCTNTHGGFNCTCNQGYVGDGLNCTDENECETKNYECDPNAYCENLNGTYQCICSTAYTGNGKTCTDVDECSSPFNTSIIEAGEWKCVKNAVCVNENGDYGCTCDKGFVGNGTQECTDVNECLDTPCNPNADCRNHPGSYECVCRGGWKGDGYQCSDLDECEKDSTNECQNGNCTNIVGDYICKCFTGYRQNGRTCVVDSGGATAKQVDACKQDSSSFKCLCNDPEARENNIMCNGLFVALLILVLVAIVVIIFVVKYIKKKKAMKIRPVRTHRDKYIEMGNESEL